jgi:hypothetical protein
MKLDPAVQQLIGVNLAGAPARVVHHPGAVHGSAMPPAPGSPPRMATRSRGRTARRSLQPRRCHRRPRGYLMPTIIESGPTSGCTWLSRKPMWASHDRQSALV